MKEEEKEALGKASSSAVDGKQKEQALEKASVVPEDVKKQEQALGNASAVPEDVKKQEQALGNASSSAVDGKKEQQALEKASVVPEAAKWFLPEEGKKVEQTLEKASVVPEAKGIALKPAPPKQRGVVVVDGHRKGRPCAREPPRGPGEIDGGGWCPCAVMEGGPSPSRCQGPGQGHAQAGWCAHHLAEAWLPGKSSLVCMVGRRSDF